VVLHLLKRIYLFYFRSKHFDNNIVSGCLSNLRGSILWICLQFRLSASSRLGYLYLHKNYSKSYFKLKLSRKDCLELLRQQRGHGIPSDCERCFNQIGGTATSTEWLDFEDLNSFTYCSRNNPPTFATNGAIDPNDGYGCREYR